MAADWPELPLAECMAAIIDYRGKTPRKTTTGIPLVTAKIIKGGRIEQPGEFIEPSDYDEWMRRGIPAAGDIVLTTEAPLGEVAQLDGSRVALAQRVITLRGKEGVMDNTFLKFLLQSAHVQEQLKGRSTGTTVHGIRQSELRKVLLLVPSLGEQRAIAHILGTLDDKIELNRKMNLTLEAMARAIFKSWFVDFDPVRAKSEGRDPGLPSDLATLFPGSFENSELGKIPKGWSVISMPEIIDINPMRSLQKGANALYLDMANAPNNGARADKVVNRPFGSGTKFINGDTLLARITPCLENGKTAFVDFLEHDQVGWGSTEFIVLRPKAPLPPTFAYFLARDPEFRAFAISNMSGTSGRQRVPSDCFNSYKLVKPGPGIAAAFGKFSDAVMQQIKANDEQSLTIAALRDTLLPKLLSGEIRVKDAKRIADATASKNEVSGEAVRKSDKRKATDEFREAILISALVRALSNNDYPLGRKRYSKICYLIHRKLQHAVEQKYFKKAAGPYSPWTRYKGPERIAIQNGYIKETQKGVFTGFSVGPQISDIDQYLPRYDFNDVLGWAVNNFGKLTNDRLELLATVDFAVLELKTKGKQVNVRTVRELIETEPEWAPKLERAIFSEINIQSALRAIGGYFPGETHGDR